MDIPGLGIRDVEGPVGAVFVCAGREVAVELKDIIHQVKLELLNVLFASLALDEFLPGKEEILYTNNILKFMSASSPPRDLCLLFKDWLPLIRFGINS